MPCGQTCILNEKLHDNLQESLTKHPILTGIQQSTVKRQVCNLNDTSYSIGMGVPSCHRAAWNNHLPHHLLDPAPEDMIQIYLPTGRGTYLVLGYDYADGSATNTHLRLAGFAFIVPWSFVDEALNVDYVCCGIAVGLSP